MNIFLYIFLIILTTSSKTINPIIDTTRILLNPYMGFEDHTVEGMYYDSSTVYNRGGTGCRAIPGGYYHLCMVNNWDNLNPVNGTYDFEDLYLFGNNLKQREMYGHTRFRNVRGVYDEPCAPYWLGTTLDETNDGEVWGCSNSNRNGIELEYYTCDFLENWGKLIEKYVESFEDIPYINMIDVGSVGWDGEWFTGKFTYDRLASGQDLCSGTKSSVYVTKDTTERVLKMFTGGKGYSRCIGKDEQEQEVYYQYNGFQTKHCFISEGDEMSVKYGMRWGCGWRFDMIGQLSGDKTNWINRILKGTIDDKWKYFPISGEYSRDVLLVPILDKLKCFSKAWHMSSIHSNYYIKPTGAENNAHLEMYRLLGYRIVLESATYNGNIQAPSALNINLVFKNDGTSPAYKKYPFYLHLKTNQNDDDPIFCQMFSSVDIRTILPPEVTNLASDMSTCTTSQESFAFNLVMNIPSIAHGTYYIYFSFLEDVYKKGIDLGLQEKDSKKRFLIGTIDITNPSFTSYTPACDESVDVLPIHRGLRPPLNEIPYQRVWKFPTQMKWVQSGGGESSDYISIRKDTREAYIEFDLTDVAMHGNQEVKGISLNLIFYQANESTASSTVVVNVLEKSWAEGSITFANRPTSSNTVVTKLGEKTTTGNDYRTLFTFNINNQYDNLFLEKKVTIYLQSKNSFDLEFAGKDYKTSKFTPWMIIYYEGSCSIDCFYGTCSGSTCSCHSGYYGSHCNSPICHTPVCSDREYCAFPDVCKCRSGWNGTYCDIPTCTPICTGNFKCIGPNVCSCKEGWTGPYCNQASGTCYPLCGNNQECHIDTCSCIIGYIGELCDHPVCDGEYICGENQNCTLPNTCSCNSGYTGEHCDIRDCTGPGHYTGIDCTECQVHYSGPTCETYTLSGNFGWTIPVIIVGVIVVIVIIGIILVVVYCFIKKKKKVSYQSQLLDKE